MIIVGLNAYHADAAACLVKDGALIAAAEEERFRRIKHWAGFPSQALAYCLKEAGLTLADVDAVAINRNNRANLLRKLAYVFTGRPSLSVIADRARNRSRWAGVAEQLMQALPGQKFAGKVEYVEHHYAHLASAFYASPFPEAAVASVDGFGDFASAAWGIGSGRSLSLEGRILFPHSLGIFYQALTQYLGFLSFGDEYKVMGLAAYGASSPCLGEVQRLLKLGSEGAFALDLTFFRHHREDIAYEWQGGAPSCRRLFSPQLEALLGPSRQPEEPLTARHRDIAYATQAVFEDAFFHYLSSLHARCPHDAIAIAGGCAYNSVANGKLRDRTPFVHSYIQAAAGDAGGAIGAAFAAWHRQGGERGGSIDHAYWGPQFASAEIAAILAAYRPEFERAGIGLRQFEHEQDLILAAARAIADGLVVGWFQGRMEWGPRALGNRSILADPRRKEMKDILNLKIKRRESFRPFAPSVLREAVGEWFEKDDDVPFMSKVFRIRSSKREQIPAVTHVDGTGRLQSVDRAGNPLYHSLIKAFCDITDVPMVLNTSFNENEPVVCRPQEALECFLRTRMDVLFLDDFMLARDQGAAAGRLERAEHRGHVQTSIGG
jgi:carbamoyltransferase